MRVPDHPTNDGKILLHPLARKCLENDGADKY